WSTQCSTASRASCAPRSSTARRGSATTPLSRRQLRDVMPGDAPKRRRAADAVLAEAAGGVAAGIEARDRPAAQIDDLRAGVDADAGIGVVDRRRMPSRIEWR